MDTLTVDLNFFTSLMATVADRTDYLMLAFNSIIPTAENYVHFMHIENFNEHFSKYKALHYLRLCTQKPQTLEALAPFEHDYRKWSLRSWMFMRGNKLINIHNSWKTNGSILQFIITVTGT